MEIFRDIEGYEGIYQVSNLGNIKSLKYEKERILKPTKNKRGYLQVNFYKSKKPKIYKVHRLVALAFLTNPDNLPCVNHKNECKTDNRLSNLEWCDSKYNINYGSRNQRMVGTRRINDPNNEWCKKAIKTKNKKGSVNAEKSVVQLSKDGVEIINTYESTMEASRQTGINQANICKCCKGRYKSAGNFVWRYL